MKIKDIPTKRLRELIKATQMAGNAASDAVVALRAELDKRNRRSNRRRGHRG